MAKRLDTRLDRLERRQGKAKDQPALIVTCDASKPEHLVGLQDRDRTYLRHDGETLEAMEHRLAKIGAGPVLVASYNEQEAKT
jgi:hypothetical protein